MHEITNPLKVAEQRKFLNFCSPVYKRYQSQIEQRTKQGYLSLQSKIRESAVKVQNVKNGQSLYDNVRIVGEYQVPILADHRLRGRLAEMVDKSLIEVSVKESDNNLALIESLSPSKKAQPNLLGKPTLKEQPSLAFTSPQRVDSSLLSDSSSMSHVASKFKLRNMLSNASQNSR